MFSQSLAKLASMLPSSVKYPLSGLRPLYTFVMGIGEPVVSVQTVAGPLRWRVDGLTSQTFLFGTYEPYMQEAFVKFVRPGSVVFDVGAHAGYHSLLCALLVGPSGRVIAFEPNPRNRESMKHQLSANPEAQVSLSPYALSDRCETVTLDVSHGSSQGYVSDEGDFIVEARKIDFLIEQEGFPDPDVIKIDVEGHEEQVLLGSLATIDKCRPVILCDRNDDSTFSKVSALLTPHGYSVSDESPITGIPYVGPRAYAQSRKV